MINEFPHPPPKSNQSSYCRSGFYVVIFWGKHSYMKFSFSDVNNPLRFYCPLPWNSKARVGKEDDFSCKCKGDYKEMPSIKSKASVMKWNKIYEGRRSSSKIPKPLEVIVFPSKLPWVFQQRKSFFWVFFFLCLHFQVCQRHCLFPRCYTLKENFKVTKNFSSNLIEPNRVQKSILKWSLISERKKSSI